MTRAILALLLSLLSLATGLWTSFLATTNHRRAENLSKLQRRLEMQQAANAQLAARAAAHVWSLDDAVPDATPQPPPQARPAAPQAVESPAWPDGTLVTLTGVEALP